MPEFDVDIGQSGSQNVIADLTQILSLTQQIQAAGGSAPTMGGGSLMGGSLGGGMGGGMGLGSVANRLLGRFAHDLLPGMGRLTNMLVRDVTRTALSAMPSVASYRQDIAVPALGLHNLLSTDAVTGGSIRRAVSAWEATLQRPLSHGMFTGKLMNAANLSGSPDAPYLDSYSPHGMPQIYYRNQTISALRRARQTSWMSKAGQQFDNLSNTMFSDAAMLGVAGAATIGIAISAYQSIRDYNQYDRNEQAFEKVIDKGGTYGLDRDQLSRLVTSEYEMRRGNLGRFWDTFTGLFNKDDFMHTFGGKNPAITSSSLPPDVASRLEEAQHFGQQVPNRIEFMFQYTRDMPDRAARLEEYRHHILDEFRYNHAEYTYQERALKENPVRTRVGGG